MPRNPGHLRPCSECGFAGLAALTERQAMTAKLEAVVDPAVSGQEAPRVAGWLEAAPSESFVSPRL